MSPRVVAVVVNLNGGDDNVRCLRSLVGQGLEEHDIVFVDNASSDDSVASVRAALPGVTVVENPENVGYGEGCNQGIERALEEGAELVFLVNNDVTFRESVLATLLEALAERPEVGIVGPRVVYAKEPDLVWCAGGRMTWRQNLSEMIGHRRPDGPEYRVTREVDYVPGCAMLVRREVFERAGLLNAAYFAYHEDVELCLDARAAGFPILVKGEVAAHHDAHSTTGGGYNERRKYMMGVNTVWFLRRNGTLARWLSFFVFDVAVLPAVWLVRALRGEGRAVRAKAIGTWDGLRGRRVTPAVLERWR